jgi:hypothetical protein
MHGRIRVLLKNLHPQSVGWVVEAVLVGNTAGADGKLVAAAVVGGQKQCDADGGALGVGGCRIPESQELASAAC